MPNNVLKVKKFQKRQNKNHNFELSNVSTKFGIWKAPFL